MAHSETHGLSGRRILLGVTGGIAVYKAANLIRLLRQEGAQVRVAMTAAAQSFISPLTLQALAGEPVRTALLDPQAEAGMDHIELARWAERVLVAPASAHFLARLAHGLADDLLTTLCLATTAPLLVAPAMNQQMWSHPATQDNLTLLRRRLVTILGPAEGEQACGETGPGRMLEPEAIADAIAASFVARTLEGCRVLLTAGPTREAIDPVRFVGNRSSGRMGYALAKALLARGARVCLVSGPTALEAPKGTECIWVESALEMSAAVMERVEHCDLFVAAAAVADYRPEQIASGKIKKDAEALTIRLVRNPDILAAVAALPEGPFTVGFAAETDKLEAHALVKLEAKGLDMIAANRVGAEQGGFERDDNALLVLWHGGRRALPLASKPEIAEQLADLIVERYHAQATGKDSRPPAG